MRISLFGILFFFQIVKSTTFTGNLISLNLVSLMSANLVSNPNPNPNPNPVSKFNRRIGVDTNRQRLKAYSKKGNVFHKYYGRPNLPQKGLSYNHSYNNHPLPIADRVEEGEIVEDLEGEGFLVENEGILNER